MQIIPFAAESLELKYFFHQKSHDNNKTILNKIREAAIILPHQKKLDSLLGCLAEKEESHFRLSNYLMKK